MTRIVKTCLIMDYQETHVHTSVRLPVHKTPVNTFLVFLFLLCEQFSFAKSHFSRLARGCNKKRIVKKQCWLCAWWDFNNFSALLIIQPIDFLKHEIILKLIYNMVLEHVQQVLTIKFLNGI